MPLKFTEGHGCWGLRGQRVLDPGWENLSRLRTFPGLIAMIQSASFNIDKRRFIFHFGVVVSIAKTICINVFRQALLISFMSEGRLCSRLLLLLNRRSGYSRLYNTVKSLIRASYASLAHASRICSFNAAFSTLPLLTGVSCSPLHLCKLPS